MIPSFLTPAALFVATALAILVATGPELPSIAADAERPAVRLGERPRAPRVAPPTVIALENGDPFRAYEQAAIAPKRGGLNGGALTFNGTMGRSAFINRKPYKVGDVLPDGSVIIEIGESRVRYRDERGGEHELLMRQPR